MDERAPDRRLGSRHVLGPVIVRWCLADGPAARVTGARSETAEAGLLDLSASGALVMARTHPDLAVGDWLDVAIRDRAGPVVIRRISPSTQPGFSQYGIEFLDPTSGLTQLVHEELDRRRGSHR